MAPKQGQLRNDESQIQAFALNEILALTCAHLENLITLGIEDLGASPLQKIRHELGDCTRCKLHSLGRKQIVFGVGAPRADLMFVGEGPGEEEDKKGEPFVGRAGKLLDKIIVAMGCKREDVYIANTVKCRPPNNRNPEPDELEACEPFWQKQVRAVRPKVIVTLGRIASQVVLGTDTTIGKLRGHFHDFNGIAVMPTYHPAFLLRSPGMKRHTWEDMQKVMERLNEAQ